jgi:hypothetical protein
VIDLVLLAILVGMVPAMFYAFAMAAAEPPKPDATVLPMCRGCRGDFCDLHGPVRR